MATFKNKFHTTLESLKTFRKTGPLAAIGAFSTMLIGTTASAPVAMAFVATFLMTMTAGEFDVLLKEGRAFSEAVGIMMAKEALVANNPTFLAEVDKAKVKTNALNGIVQNNQLWQTANGKKLLAAAGVDPADSASVLQLVTTICETEKNPYGKEEKTAVNKVLDQYRKACQAPHDFVARQISVLDLTRQWARVKNTAAWREQVQDAFTRALTGILAKNAHDATPLSNITQHYEYLRCSASWMNKVMQTLVVLKWVDLSVGEWMEVSYGLRIGIKAITRELTDCFLHDALQAKRDVARKPFNPKARPVDWAANGMLGQTNMVLSACGFPLIE
jgi:hypothetical protein